jgi:hypothetical protein
MSSSSKVPPVSIPSEADVQQLPEDKRQRQAADASKAAASAQSIVDSLKSKAAILTDPKERERVLSEAYDHEIEARGLSKKAQMLGSGTFQGAVGGAGIGAATGVGLGTAVGTLVGTVASVPTTAVGGLVGAGTGAIHGPWIKLPGKSGKEGGGGGEEEEEEEKVVQVSQETIDSGAVQVDDQTGQVTVQDPEALEGAVSAEPAATSSDDCERAKGDASERRKPKKLEIRSDKQWTAGKTEPSTQSEAEPKKNPPKLETPLKKSD